MARPVILGVVGDSATGKTTFTRGLVRLLGEENVTHVCTDDYHRYDRSQRAELNITPLDPDCNYMDIMAQDIAHLSRGNAILKPVYQHTDGTFGPPVYIDPARFTIVEGLLGYYTSEMRDSYDVRVFLSPPEEIRRQWKVSRDCSRRGYTTDQVLAELDRREPDSEAFIRPQRRYADIVVSFVPGESDAADELDAHLILGPDLPHPDLSPLVTGGPGGISMVDQGRDRLVVIPGRIDPDQAAEIEEAIWQRMHFASHLRAGRLGEFTVGTQLQRSESLAVVQLLVLYHLATATAAVALGGTGARTRHRPEGVPAVAAIAAAQVQEAAS